ncbi:AbrB/MazE/SpoVT family DNA-binding domain-containing protein [Paenibacillus pasadenensis]|uniref:AbrB/MazE/SpoVT family DNA-binding domain-containing protein n=1 Tax=Paenibacillus TaxID=44249 RepID=UPI0005B89412|nr:MULTISPECIES: AbrB/MazE/SpoVT family DNA-binding domain-containing protein [Paenibacillus]QGG58356.1 AbrB/MazE/SpoVT family DNA-binding domain-containing protein [Paenibacillus sp. B01]
MAIANEVMNGMEWKRARVSPKRQVTIPQKLFEQAGIQDEVEFSIKGSHIIIRPVREQAGNDYYADLILADLIQEGYVGSELLSKFREKQQALKAAVKTMISESQDAARHFEGSDRTEAIFGDVMED